MTNDINNIHGSYKCNQDMSVGVVAPRLQSGDTLQPLSLNQLLLHQLSISVMAAS